MLDINKVLQGLAMDRPVFHSEADFQFALAWAIQKADNVAAVRLEYPAFSEDVKDRWVDIWVRTAVGPVAIELKYIPRKVRLVTEKDEVFNLKNHAAPDQRRFDYVYDICRLESLSRLHTNFVGYAILVTNSSSFWNPGRKCQGEAFKVDEDRCLKGSLAWADGTSKGTKAGRADSLTLTGKYTMNWRPYSSVADVKGGEFRYLLTKVEPVAPKAKE